MLETAIRTTLGLIYLALMIAPFAAAFLVGRWAERHGKRGFAIAAIAGAAFLVTGLVSVPTAEQIQIAAQRLDR